MVIMQHYRSIPALGISKQAKGHPVVCFTLGLYTFVEQIKLNWHYKMKKCILQDFLRTLEHKAQQLTVTQANRLSLQQWKNVRKQQGRAYDFRWLSFPLPATRGRSNKQLKRQRTVLNCFKNRRNTEWFWRTSITHKTLLDTKIELPHIHAYTCRQRRETLRHMYLHHTFLIKPWLLCSQGGSRGSTESQSLLFLLVIAPHRILN